ncbi:hypothetical protein BMR07_14765 [Methylococcaceae bacterium CS1]|nr:hypothetical protein BMR07_14765 [Methylococcaceae bacterium CS1]
MNDVNSNNQTGQIHFYQGSEALKTKNSLDAIKQKMAEFSNVKNVSFLLGAGVSSGAILDMKGMHDEISQDINKNTNLEDKTKDLYKKLSGDNLEKVLGVLYAKKHFLEGTIKPDKTEKDSVNELINHIQDQMFFKINIDLLGEKAAETLSLYKKLYQKVALRNKDLSRINIFTTNNDLFNEKALDNLNINYNNGFGGGLERVFNPARFNYTFSKKIDANLEKFEPLENMVYLYKLHGSISWIEKEGNSLFNTQEVPIEGGTEKQNKEHVLIYPTPLKQNQSLGSPYSDLIREFQTKLAQPNSVLFIIGYSFSDEHLNNIIYQSLASNSSISVVIFGKYEDCPLSKINDNRIYRIFGESETGENIHYFESIVNKLLPDLDENKEKSLLEEFVKELTKSAVTGA